MAKSNYAMPPVGGAARKPKTSAYTMMLLISFIALLVGCIFLFLEIKRYGGFGTIRGTVRATTAPASVQMAQATRELTSVA